MMFDNPFSFKPGVIDHKSAKALLKVVSNGEISGDGLANALCNVLAFKLSEGRDGRPTDPKSKHICDKMERFFDNMFEIAPEHKPMKRSKVIEMLERIVVDLQRDADDARADKEPDMVEMYEADRDDWKAAILLLQAKDDAGFMRAWSNMDTACRDRLWGKTKKEAAQLGLFMSQARG